MDMCTLCIKNATLVLDGQQTIEHGSILVENGKIVKIR